MNSTWECIAWWEIRRIAFNALLLVAGLLTFVIILLAGTWLFGELDDFAEPFAWLIFAVLYGILANIAYTLGWISELLWAQGDTEHTKPARRRVFWLGTMFSVALTLLPAALIPLIWILQSR